MFYGANSMKLFQRMHRTHRLLLSCIVSHVSCMRKMASDDVTGYRALVRVTLARFKLLVQLLRLLASV